MKKIMERNSAVSIGHLPDNALIKLKTVLAQFDELGKTSWYEGIKQGKYPRPVKINRASRWVVGEIRSCLNALAAQPR